MDFSSNLDLDIWSSHLHGSDRDTLLKVLRGTDRAQ